MMRHYEELAEKVVVVTGAASGIGIATATRFAQAGSHVMLADVDRDAGSRATEKLRAQGLSVKFRATDVGKSDEVRELMADTLAEWGPLSILVNNAGISEYHRLEDTTESSWDQVIRINLKSMYLCTYHALPQLRRRGGGVIVNLASVHSFRNRPGNTAYAVSKAGVLAFTQQVAIELAPENIRVACVAPNTVDTPMLRRTLKNPSEPEVELKGWAHRNPLGKLIQPEDVAAAVLYLASDDARFITGSAIIVDGGIVAGLP